MANLTILSWNIQKFSDRKLRDAVWFIGTVVKAYQVNVLVVMETVKDKTTLIAHDLWRALGENEWYPMGTEETGKSHELPEKLTYQRFTNLGLALEDYWKELKPCYYKRPFGLELKPESKRPAEADGVARASLLWSGVWRPRTQYETYVSLVRVEPARASRKGVFISGSYIQVVSSSELWSTDSNGKEIGYANPSSRFNGRKPFHMQMAVTDSTGIAQSYFPIVVFHAPFGDSDETGLMRRTEANNSLLRLRTNAPVPVPLKPIDLRDSSIGIVAGDFNIDYLSTLDCALPPRKPTKAQTASVGTYCPFRKSGFDVRIAEKSTLIHEVPKTPPTESSDYRKSAYDNIIDKGMVLKKAGVVDLIKDIYCAGQPPGNYLTGIVPVMKNMYSAYQYYLKHISDHLPAFASYQVPGP